MTPRWTSANISYFRSRNLFQPYQSAHPSGYYDASLGRGYERATISLRSGWCAGVTAYGGGSEASAQDHLLPRRRRSAWIPMVASFEQRLTQSRSQSLLL